MDYVLNFRMCDTAGPTADTDDVDSTLAMDLLRVRYGI